jgi:hypothetical protein
LIRKSRLIRFLPILVLVIASLYGLTRLGIIHLPRHYDPLALPDLANPPNFVTPLQLKLIDTVPENCRLALNEVLPTAILRNFPMEKSYCLRMDTVPLRNLWKAKIRPEDTRCAMAARLYLWERHVVQPAAQLLFGEPVTEILHFGSYSCRTIRGSRFASQHATANAFDIAGFRLASGKLISVKTDWPGSGLKATFLRTVRDGACDDFNLVLSPDYNADHADHFHVDMGWYRGCN